jgi:hypothetical protein
MNMGTKLLFAFSLGIPSWGGVCAAQEYEFSNGYPTSENGATRSGRTGLPARRTDLSVLLSHRLNGGDIPGHT